MLRESGFWLLLAGAFVFSLLATHAVRRYALARQLIDIPNARSSHAIPTPRGGGIAIVGAFCLLVPLLGWGADLPLAALLGCGLLVAAVGFVDDHQPIPARWRLLAHFCAAAWGLWLLGGFPAYTVLALEIVWLGNILAALYLVWLLNLYNFMDGIDGLAALEAVTVAGGGALLWWLARPSTGPLVTLILAAAAAGFLVWNFPPARIFMGDAGSGFLGVTLGVLSIWAAQETQTLFWCWLILLGVFIVDATVTLFRRLVRRLPLAVAHRSHAYQYAARKFGGHRAVTLTAAMINVFWLFPLAVGVVYGVIDGVVALLVAYIPLVLLAFYFKAGAAELQEV